MDITEKTVEIIKKYYNYMDGKISKNEFIKIVCNYFDEIKYNPNVKNYIEILIRLANVIGVPQYVKMLENFQDNEIVTDEITMNVMSAIFNEAKLMVSENIMLHQKQYDFLKLFNNTQQNRYILTAPTSFGKTFVVYEIIKKMEYTNIVLIFPTISLLSENYDKLLQNEEYEKLRETYKIHTLSNIEEVGEKNIWIYTPERYMSFVDKNPEQAFDFVFIDEIYKIDNQFDLRDSITENERDTAFRLALSYSCEKSKDILLAGPYIETSIDNKKHKNISFDNFVEENGFIVVNYNDYEIVNKDIIEIKGKKQYKIDNKEFNFENTTSKARKLITILETLKESDENAIVYCKSRADTERYANLFLSSSESDMLRKVEEDKEKIFNIFLNHLKEKFGEEWILYKSLKRGIGIHHGLVPKYIQKQVIEFFNNGIIRYIFSTTTITEGVNTSAKNIIITSDNKGLKKLKHFDAQNIAGRAGRFTKHYKGNVIILSSNFEQILTDEGEKIKHKNYDDTEKNEIDYYMTKEKYLSEKDKENKEKLKKEQKKRDIPDNIMQQFKAVGYTDKIKVYDKIKSGIYNNSIKNFIKTINMSHISFEWNDFDNILQIILPIIPKESNLYNLIINKSKSGTSILTIKLHSYLKGGYYNLLQYQVNKKGLSIDNAIRDTGDFIYNILKYQLVKYLGVFDLMYRYIKSIENNIALDEVTGISKIMQILEYNALSNKAKIVSDYGAPFNVVRSYEDENNVVENEFDSYEKYIKLKIDLILKDKQID